MGRSLSDSAIWQHSRIHSGYIGVCRDLSGFRLWPVEAGGIPGPSAAADGGPGAPSSVVYKACRTGASRQLPLGQAKRGSGCLYMEHFLDTRQPPSIVFAK